MKKTNNVTKSTISLFFIFTLISSSYCQTIIYEENFGNPTNTILLAQYNGWQNQSVIYTSDTTCDIRNSNLSNGYEGASGGGNVMLNNPAKWFQIAGLNTLEYDSLVLKMGIRKNITAENGSNFSVQVSTDGINWTRLQMQDTLPTGSGTTGWYLRDFKNIPSCANLRIKFSNLSTGDFRLDDIKLTTSTHLTSPMITIISPVHGGIYENGITLNLQIENFELGTDGKLSLKIIGREDTLSTLFTQSQALFDYQNSAIHLDTGRYTIIASLLHPDETPYSPEISISRNFKIVLPVVSPPFFTPAGGTYYAAQSVSIGSATEHAVIYYTLDGTQPTSGSLLYTEAITVNSNIQIRAIACHASMEESSIVSANYVIRDTNAFIELPFDLSDNSTTERLDITLINGVYSVHLGSSYADGGAKFETAAAGAATLTIKMNTVPDKLWFDLRGRIGGSSPQAYSGIRFNILQSSDGQQWNTLASLTEQDIPIENYETFPEYQIDRATRFIKWHLVEASKGNTQLNNIKISKYEAVPEDTTYISCSKLPTIVIYPNPTSDILKINIGNTGVTNITLFSLLGEKIQEIETKNTYFEIIMTKYSKGIYFIHFKTTQGVFIKKIMKI